MTESERLAMTDGEAHVGVLVMTEAFGMTGGYGVTGAFGDIIVMLVMLNLFQHLSFHCSNGQIPKQVRNDRGVRNDRATPATSTPPQPRH